MKNEKKAWDSLFGGGLYFLLALGSMLFQFGPASLAAFWPANGFLLAWILTGPRGKGAVTLAAGIVAAVAANLVHGRPPGLSLFLGAANGVEVLAAWRMVGWLRIESDILASHASLLKFFMLAVPAAAAAGALSGSLVVVAAAGAPFLETARHWFLVDAAGLAVMALPVLAWRSLSCRFPEGWRGRGELALILSVTLAATHLLFSDTGFIVAALGSSFPFPLFPLLLWAALRLGVAGAASVNLAAYALLAWHTAQGRGPFAIPDHPEAGILVSMQLFPFAISLCTLLPAVLLRNRDRLAAELRKGEARFGHLWGSRLVGMFVTDSEGKVVEANDSFLELTHTDRAALKAGDIVTTRMTTPEYLERLPEIRRKFREQGQVGPFEREWVLPDGKRLHSLVYASRADDGNAVGMLLDIGHLKRVQQELRVSETRFRHLQESNLLGIAILRGQLFIEANEAFLKLVGYSRDDLESGRILALNLRLPEELEQARRIEQEVQGSGRLDPSECTYVRKDGSKVHVFRGVARLKEEDAYLIMAVDISFLKEVQANLEEARRSAEAANSAKSEFLTHMSHEIRTPLNGVLGMLSLLEDTSLTSEQRGYSDTARESGNHLLSLINQFLDFSKIESGNLKLELGVFSLDNLVDGTLSTLHEPSARKGLHLSARIDPAVPEWLVGDSLRLQQILLNLVGNAVKFTASGEVRLEVHALATAGEEVDLHFVVADQGPGIAGETQARLFQAFQQGDSSLARRAGGTGLGLAISKELVSKMGGRIWVDSEPGKGSRFQFVIQLPAASPPHAAEDSGPAGLRVLLPGLEHPSVADLKASLDRLGLAGSVVAYPGDFDSLPGHPAGRSVFLIPCGDGPGPDFVADLWLPAAQEAGLPVLCLLPSICPSQSERLQRAGAALVLSEPIRPGALRSALLGLEAGDASRTRSPGRGSEPLAGPAPGSHAARILVVDDHPVNLVVAANMLAKLGCQVDTAGEGAAALSACAAKAYDLIFMDCQMPEMDGYACTRELRRREGSGPRKAIIALTAHAVKGTRESCLEAGMDDYITKPFTRQELSRALKEWIGRTGQAESPVPDPAPRHPDGLVDASRMDMLDDGTPEGGAMRRKLVALFLETTHKSLGKLREDWQAGRSTDLAKGLHRLKGSCSTIGANGMVKDLAAMEAMDGDGGGMGRLMEKLEQDFQATERELGARA